MKKYVTIPFNTYKELDKEKLHTDTTSKQIQKETSLIGEKKKDTEIKTHDESSIIEQKATEKKSKPKKIELELNKPISRSSDSSSSNNNNNNNNNNSNKDLPHSKLVTAESEVEELRLDDPALPPPGIPKNKKSISIIKHNRITRNKGRWHTPWKTRFS